MVVVTTVVGVCDGGGCFALRWLGLVVATVVGVCGGGGRCCEGGFCCGVVFLLCMGLMVVVIAAAAVGTVTLVVL